MQFVPQVKTNTILFLLHKLNKDNNFISSPINIFSLTLLYDWHLGGTVKAVEMVTSIGFATWWNKNTIQVKVLLPNFIVYIFKQWEKPGLKNQETLYKYNGLWIDYSQIQTTATSNTLLQNDCGLRKHFPHSDY